jgi:hypothetical protein
VKQPLLAAPPELGPGQNLIPDWGGGGWVYLLPRMELSRVVTIGQPSTATMATLRRVAHEVVVLHGGRGGASSEGTAPLWKAAGQIAPDSADAIAVLGAAAARQVARSSSLRALLSRALAPEGLVYVQPVGDGVTGQGLALDDALAADFGSANVLWLMTRSNELRAAAPLHDPSAIAYLGRSMGTRVRPSPIMRIAHRLRGRPRARWQTAVAILAGQDVDGGPPRYVVDLAATAGVDLSRHRWALMDPGRYRTKKVIMFLFEGANDQPEFVMKVAREPEFNARMENARRALTVLEHAGLTSIGAAPRVGFAGHHAGVAILAESALAGRSLADQLNGDPIPPGLVAAVECLVAIGIRTAHATSAGGREVAAALRQMLEQFRTLYEPEPALVNFLERQVSIIEAHRDAIPLVLQHGDAGAWNVIVDAAGRPAFIDWEAAVVDGAPLWDILHLLNSGAVGIAQRRGERNQARVFDGQFLKPSPLSDVLSSAIGTFCEATGMSRDLVEPLFHLCWMHRSLKEASRLPPNRLARSRYLRTLRLCLDRRSEATSPLPFAP